MSSLKRLFQSNHPQCDSGEDPLSREIEARIEALFPNYRGDHLGDAAVAANEAVEAIRNKDFERAWRLLHKQKEHYARHAARAEFTPKQVLALDASVSAQLANVLRLEERHHEALVHAIYWVACAPRRTKDQEAKLPAYFRRAKLPGVAQSDLERFIANLQPLPDLRAIQMQVARWRGRDDGT